MTAFGVYSKQQECTSGSNIYINSENIEVIVSEIFYAKNLTKAKKYFDNFKMFYSDAEFNGQIIKYSRSGRRDVPSAYLSNCPIEIIIKPIKKKNKILGIFLIFTA